jgi:tRNA (uracil-5-)-methyltransferase TRM9
MSDRDPRARVKATYDRIADHFAQTRAYPWPEVEAFLEGRSGAVALDLGCGNGRHAEALAAHAGRVVGVDVSHGLLAAARERARERAYAVELLLGDASRLPLAGDSVALAVYVATLHHLPTRESRRASLDELARVLGDGVGLVSAWSTAHDRFADEPAARRDGGFDTTVDWTLPGGETVPRFYHIYAPGEFEADLAASDLRVERCWLSSGNCYAVVRGRTSREPRRA